MIDKKHIYATLFVLLTLTMSGCGSKHYDLTRSTFMTGFKGKGKIVVAVKDQRPFVLNGDEETTYIGRRSDINGNQRPILTRSGRSVADDLSELIAGAIRENGFQTEIVDFRRQDELSLEKDNLRFDDSDRTILVAINDLWLDLSVPTELKWSFNLEVYNERGALCAQKQNTGGSIFGNKGHTAFQGKVGGILMEMFGSPEVVTAMTFESSRNNIGARVETINQTIQSAHDISAVTSENVAVLEQYLRNGEITSFRYYARQVSKKPSNNQQVLDGLAEIIWKEKDNDNKYIIDGLCHLCRTFQRSRQPRYKSLFEWLKENGSTFKLRRYAGKASKNIFTAGVPQFQPWKVAEQDVEVVAAVEVDETMKVVEVNSESLSVIPDQKSSDLQNIPELDNSVTVNKNKNDSDGPEKKILLGIYIDELGYDGVGESATTRSNVSMMFYGQEADVGFEQEVIDSRKDINEFHQRVLSEVNRNLKNKTITPIKLYMSGNVLEEINQNAMENNLQLCPLTAAAELLFDKILMMFMSVDSASPFDLQINLVGYGNGAVVGKHLLNLLSGVNTDLGKSKISFHGAVFFDPVISVDRIDLNSCRNLLVHYPRIANDGPEILEIIAANADRKTYPLVVYKKSQAEQKSTPGGHM